LQTTTVRLKQHNLQLECAEKAMKISINVIPEVFIGNPEGASKHPVSLADTGQESKTLDAAMPPPETRLKIAGMTEEGCFFTGHYWLQT